jgi:hypothetical protein
MFRNYLMRGIALTAAIALMGCATRPSSSSYVRLDGRPTVAAQTRAMLAQCEGEGAFTVADYVTREGMAGMFSRSSKEEAVTDACMVRNGYILQ